MLVEEHHGLERREKRTPVGLYFRRVQALELSDGYLHQLSSEARDVYTEELRQAYDLLYDRIMNSGISSFLKQEVELWYDFNRDFWGFSETMGMNRELEQILRRFELL